MKNKANVRNMNIFSQQNEKQIWLRAKDRLLIYVTLSFDSVKEKANCYLYPFSNYCTKYEHPRLKMTEEFALRVIRQVLHM